MPKTYADSAYNRGVGRVGLPVGSAVISKNTVCGINTKTYADNAYNWQIGRVGMPHGSAVKSKYSDGLTAWNYLDEREVRPFTQKTGYTEYALDRCRDMKHAWRESDIADLHQQHRNKDSVSNTREWRRPNSRERRRSNSKERRRSNSSESGRSSSSESLRSNSSESRRPSSRERRKFSSRERRSSNSNESENYLDTDRPEKQRHQFDLKTKNALDRSRDMKHVWRESGNAGFYLQPRHKDSVSKSGNWRRSDSRKNESGADIEMADRDFHEIVTCRICHKDMESSSLTPCGHHFCTHCFLQRLERKQRCPVCKTRLSGSQLIQDEEFDRIVELYKREVMQLKAQIQELTENKKSQEAIRRETEDRYWQLARQLKEKSEQKQKQKRQNDRNTLSENELEVIQQLQHYYDREFRRKFPITESMMHKLRYKTDAVVDKVSTRTDIGDGLVELVRNYTSLIKENAILHQAAIKYEEEQTRLKRKLRDSRSFSEWQKTIGATVGSISSRVGTWGESSTFPRTHELERKYQLERTLSEE